MSNFENLKSNRLTYRPFVEEDFDDLYQILGNEDVCRFIPGPAKYSEEDVKKWLRFFIDSFSLEEKHVIYAVSLKGDDRVIGYCGCNYVKEFEKNEIKYFLNANFFRRGYGLEMAFRMKHLARDLGFKNLVGLVDKNNIYSQKILEKIGYKFKEEIELWGSNIKYYEIDLYS